MGLLRGGAMLKENSSKNQLAIPEKHFLKWLKEEASITRSKLRYDFAKEALPHCTMIIVFILVVIFPRPELMALGAALISLAFKISKKV